MGYGSTTNCIGLTPCTQVFNGMSTSATLQAVTSSGVYVYVGDLSKTMLMVMNATPEATGVLDLYIQRSSYYQSVSVGDYTSQGRAVGTVNLTGLAPAGACATHANISTAVRVTFIGPLDSREYKTSENTIYVFTSSKQTSNQFVYLAAYQMWGGSTA